MRIKPIYYVLVIVDIRHRGSKTEISVWNQIIGIANAKTIRTMPHQIHPPTVNFAHCTSAIDRWVSQYFAVLIRYIIVTSSASEFLNRKIIKNRSLFISFFLFTYRLTNPHVRIEKLTIQYTSIAHTLFSTKLISKTRFVICHLIKRTIFHTTLFVIHVGFVFYITL